MSDINIQEYLAQAQQGLMGRYFGEDFLQKQTYLSVSTSTFNQTYGRKVWDALNNRTVFYNAIPKRPWGPTAGWVLRTDRGKTTTTNRSQPVTETGSLPTVDVSNFVGAYGLPKIPAATMGVSLKNIFVNTLEGGMGDVLSIELEACERDFVKEVNEELLAASYCGVSAGAATTFTVPAAYAHHFKIGDGVSQWDDNLNALDATRDATPSVVSGVNTSTGVVTIATGTAFANGDVAFIKSRAGLTSIDDICAYDGMLVFTGTQANQVQVDAYNLTTRATGGYAGGLASYNSGTARDLSLTLLDARIQAVREAGGTPRLILTGWDQYYKLEQLLQSQQRYMGEGTYSVGVGDESTLPGTRVGMNLATYQGIPILPDPDTPKSMNSSDTVIGSKLYVLDTDYLEIAVAMPTQYIENRNYFDADALVVRGLFFAMMELRATRLDVQAVLGDLSA